MQFDHASQPLRVLILTAAFLLATYAQPCASELIRIDETTRPDFSLQDLTGRDVALRDFAGRTVLVHFFATWCEPCREELPALTRLLERSPGVAVLAISVAENGQRVGRFFQQTPVGFPVLLDVERKVAKSWGVTALPTTYVLDAAMRPRLMVEADYAWDSVGFGADGQLVSRQNDIKPTSE
ncbi:TlpA disulfide reductase family protein [Tardiphaga sp.]|uniref:TlpA family protein disulfide reductase n=1 Tax=Tardiphaga sp. TaxID=1926292 RepID=UPI0026155143|nr:TlpA disulfide reductase family protein [Tardiphaga sp.]MDB5617151.1 putative thiol-disulfide isomerase [Tardiphaga sp.]